MAIVVWEMMGAIHQQSEVQLSLVCDLVYNDVYQLLQSSVSKSCFQYNILSINNNIKSFIQTLYLPTDSSYVEII